MARFVDWGHWGISFWEGDRAARPHCIAKIFFPCGPQGPMDGFIGSKERKRYEAACREWSDAGTLPEGAFCCVDDRWLHDVTCPDARWIGGRWVSAVARGREWIFPEAA